MHAENWKTIKDVLLQALKLDASGRRDYLAHARLSAEAREEVESLLKLETEAESFMSLTVGEFSKDFLDRNEPVANARINERIGIYQIVSELGCGGMGAVYLATRTDGKFEQRVAIKMLKRELNVEIVRRNFAREKEILATLAHTNIATLLDAGTTADGIPYLVMEYIEGAPIDEFCERQQLSLKHKLKLFSKVCDAVAFAHRNLIVHRDLKPSNILVTKDGEPKLLDFGISKLLDAKAEEANTATNFSAMTPQYASPEQLKGEPVTTATDVYSLGVVLFKLLIGKLPNNSDIATAKLKGDLQNIILKSLRKEPERRYQTVEQFCADIWRFVDGLPVLARPATFSYRASKFYRRNKVSVIAAALVVVSLFAGVAVAVSQANAAKAQAHIASEARRDAELETARARVEEAKAEKVSRFMQSFLDYANPHWYGRGNGRLDTTVREAIDDAAARIDTELADEPEVRADLHYTIGEVYRTHGEHEFSLRHFQRSLELYRQVYGEQHPKVARGLYYLSIVINRGDLSKAEESESLLRQGIFIMRQNDSDNVNLPYMLQSLAGWLMLSEQQSRNESRLAEAESMILEAKTLFIRHYGENHIATITADGSLSTLALTRGDLAQAESIRAENLRRIRQAGEEDYAYILSLTSLAEVKLRLGKEAEAEALFAQSFASARKQWDANDFRFKQLVAHVNKARAAMRE